MMDPMKTRTATNDLALAREVWRLLLQVVMADHRRRFERVAQTTDLSMPQSYALLELDPERGPLSMRTLARCLHNDPSNITGLVDRLEAKGLVERQADPADRRVKALVLTDAGRRARATLQEIVEEPPAALTRRSAEELRTLRDALQSLATAE